MNQETESNIFLIKSMPWAEFNVSALIRVFSYNQTNKYSNMVSLIMKSTGIDRTWDSTVIEDPKLWLHPHPLFPLHKRAVTLLRSYFPITSVSLKVKMGSLHLLETL